MEYNEALYAGKLHGENKVKSDYLDNGRTIRDYYYLPEERLAVITDTFPEANGEDDVSFDNWQVVKVSDKVATLL